MWLRTMRLMGGGGAAQREAQRMVLEKVEAMGELALSSASIDSPAAARRALQPIKRRVAANRRRLARK